MPSLDELIIHFDKALRTVFVPSKGDRPLPGKDLPDPDLSESEKKQVISLMRINHAGEVCAQALYQGQSLTAKTPELKEVLEEAAREEVDHLAWTEKRLQELGGKTSLFDPLFYAGAFTIGAVAGLIGDGVNLGFLAETERQVEQHLSGHLAQLPEADTKSRAILDQMKEDEIKHANTAVTHGGVELPEIVKSAMKLSAKVMTSTTAIL